MAGVVGPLVLFFRAALMSSPALMSSRSLPMEALPLIARIDKYKREIKKRGEAFSVQDSKFREETRDAFVKFVAGFRDSLEYSRE